MDREELKKVLDKEGVKPVYYSLNGLSGGPYNGAIILEKEGNKWLLGSDVKNRHQTFHAASNPA
jgi:hypothetical protein